MRIASLAALLVLLAGCDLPYSPGPGDFASELERRKGRLTEVREWLVAEMPDHRLVDLDLVSSSGLRATARLRLPLGPDAGGPRPGVVLIGGRDTGRHAVSYVPEGVGEVVVSPEYPALLRVREGRAALRQVEEIRSAAMDMPAILMLLADYLATRREVDAERIVLIGASFGGFFAPVAAAADPRFRNTALLYTGADLPSLVEANVGEDVPAAARQLGAELAVLPLQRLEPARYVGMLAPRHLLMVNGLHDERIPRRSVEALERAAREPKELVWLPTGHLSPDSTRLIGELVDSAFARMPLLRERR